VTVEKSLKTTIPTSFSIREVHNYYYTHSLHRMGHRQLPTPKTKLPTVTEGKGKASSLDIAPLTILNSGTLQPRKWQLTGTDCSTAAHAVAAHSPR